MDQIASQGAPEPSERRRLPPEERRRMIVEGAAAFFADVGLDGKTRDLASRLGVTQSLLFNYFANKAELIEAVYEHVYIDRMSPDWQAHLTDRSQPLRDRILSFYAEYSAAIFQHEWLRIFMFSGLAGTALNRRYLEHMGTVLLGPMLEEIRAAAPGPDLPGVEDIWNLHGGIIYIGIRRHIYQMPTPEDPMPAIEAAVDRFLRAYGL
ncbi:TetR/AcrR family transcriptional regulator [Halovulum dunhuangense]|uniref:TetR/AcrR family transcriptional regulator n=1 Tax=Halovulum dunhuangense TaxID=1505036 RepID=A0A849L238_9RHOB|nr:TetR/AcrR family transcriptional regulator [Halovulum dunhuangense]NNU80333.1 TetR/AcrR family transcriptional regulator [Halovulum dunhuangense]